MRIASWAKVLVDGYDLDKVMLLHVPQVVSNKQIRKFDVYKWVMRTVGACPRNNLSRFNQIFKETIKFAGLGFEGKRVGPP